MRRVLLFLSIIIVLYLFTLRDNNIEVVEKININQIKSIVFIQTTTGYSESDGKVVVVKKIYYSKPDKFRIETVDKVNAVEVINKYKYVYYNDRLDKIIVRHTIPKIELEIFDICNMINDSNAEFQGYENKGNITYRIVAIKNNFDDKKYIKKIWFFEHEGMNLPYKIEYFINNTIVSQSKFEYISINKPIDDELFDIDSFPERNLVYEGSEAVYFLNIEDTLKYLSFIPKVSVSGDFYLSEIKLNRVEDENILSLTYIKDDVKIFVIEKKTDKSEKGYSIRSEEEHLKVEFNEDGINIQVIGRAEDYIDIMHLCSSITQRINFEAIDGEYEDE